MFCPNCGAPNPDTATTCQKCGFNVKGTASPKFKGTMLMMNAQGGVPGIPNPGVTPPMPVGVPAPGNPNPSGPGPVAPPEGVNPKLKGTMIGVAPPSLGAVRPPSGTQPSPLAPAAPAGVAAPVGPAPVVNPLGSTLAADAGMLSPFAQGGQFAPHAAHPQPGIPQPAPYAQPGSGPVPGGGVPPTQPGSELQSYAQPPAADYTGAPPPQAPTMGAQQPGMPPGAMPYGSAPYGSAPYGSAPYGSAPYGSAPGALVSVGTIGSAGFTQRSPVGLFFLTLVTCGIYAYFWYAGTAKEMEAKGATIGPWWHLLIPILNIIWVWKWCQGLEHVSRGQLSAGTNLLKLFFLGIIGMAWLQSSINKL